MNKIPLLILVMAIAPVYLTRVPRFLGLSYLFGGSEESKTTYPTPPDLSGHPVWKVHKYNGITIHPVPVVSEAGLSYPPPKKENYGESPPTYAPPQDTYGIPTESTADVASSLDTLSSLSALLPDEGTDIPRNGYVRRVVDGLLNAKSNIGNIISGLAEGKRTALDVLSPSKGSGPDTASLLLGLLSQYPQLAELFSRVQEDEGFQLPSLPDLPPIPTIHGLDKIPKLPKLPVLKIPKHWATYEKQTSSPYAAEEPPSLQAHYGPDLPTAYEPLKDPIPYSVPETTPEAHPSQPDSSYNPPAPDPETISYAPPESTYGVPEEPSYRPSTTFEPPQPTPYYTASVAQLTDGLPEKQQNRPSVSPLSTDPATSTSLASSASPTTHTISPSVEVTYAAVADLPLPYHIPIKEVSWKSPKKTYPTSHPVVYETVPGKVTTVVYPEEHYGPEYIPPLLDTIGQQWGRSSDSNQEILTSEDSEQPPSPFFPLDEDYVPQFVQFRDEKEANSREFPVSQAISNFSNRFRGKVHVAQGQVTIDSPSQR